MTAFIAALPMYDWSEARAETDAEWRALRDRLRAAGLPAPEQPIRRNAELPPVPGGIRDAGGAVIAPDPATLPPDELDFRTVWRHPQLLLAQTCWGPLEQGLDSDVHVVGQPDYSRFEGGQGELYSSAILMRRGASTPPSGLPAISPARGEIGTASPLGDKPISPLAGEMAGRPEGGMKGRRRSDEPPPADGRAVLPLDRLRDARLAFNSRDSMSGIIALSRDLAAMGESLAIFAEEVETGGHRASALAVADGRADVCAVDCRTLDLIRRFEPDTAARVAVVGWTGRRKGLPYVTSRGLPVEMVAAMRAALAGSSDQPAASLASSG